MRQCCTAIIIIKNEMVHPSILSILFNALQKYRLRKTSYMICNSRNAFTYFHIGGMPKSMFLENLLSIINYRKIHNPHVHQVTYVCCVVYPGLMMFINE